MKVEINSSLTKIIDMSPIFVLLGAILLNNAVDGQTVKDCPGVVTDGNTKIHGTTCYRFVTYLFRQFNDAESYCMGWGGHLAIVKSADVNNFISDTMVKSYGGKRVWIGLSDHDLEDTFVWVDGTKLGGFAPWGPTQSKGPLHELEDCVLLDPKSKTWLDNHCKNEVFGLLNFEHHFVCQYELPANNDVTAITPTSTTHNPTTTTSPSTTPNSTTTASALATTVRHSCPVFTCELDCGLNGKQKDGNGCPICKCEN